MGQQMGRPLEVWTLCDAATSPAPPPGCGLHQLLTHKTPCGWRNLVTVHGLKESERRESRTLGSTGGSAGQKLCYTPWTASFCILPGRLWTFLSMQDPWSFTLSSFCSLFASCLGQGPPVVLPASQLSPYIGIPISLSGGERVTVPFGCVKADPWGPNMKPKTSKSVPRPFPTGPSMSLFLN